MAPRSGAFWRGQIYFTAWGEQISRFINEALQDHIVLFQAQKSEKGLRARVSLRDFPKLRRAARVSRTRIRIAAKYGLPFILARWWRRKGLLAGIALMAITIAVMSQLVLTVTVSGNKVLNAERILQQASGMGLKTWVWQNDLDLNKIAKEIQEQNPDAAWVGIERQGTRVEIKIVEKIRPVIPSEAGNMVAAKTGFVKEIMVIQGIPQIHEGEMVRAGQVLIAKAPVPNGQGIANASKEAAKGFVRGRVWYSAESRVPLVEDKVEESGQAAKGWGIKFGSRVIMVTTPDSPFAQAKKEVESRPLLSWRNWRFPVEVINVKYKELRLTHYERSIPMARQMAESLARAEVYQKITPGIAPIEEAVKVISNSPGVERVRVEVETYEDLAVYANP